MKLLEPIHRFFEHWTLKEAYVKARVEKDKNSTYKDVKNYRDVRLLTSEKLELGSAKGWKAVIDTDRNELQIATAGHYPPMLSERESHGPTGGLGARSLTMESGLVLGIEPEAAFNTGRFPLQQGSGLLFYTDGVIEARSPGGDYFTTAGIRRALEALRPDPEAKAQGMVDAVVAAVEQFRADRELLDDLTLVAVQLQPGNRPGADHTSARTEPLVVAV